MTRKAMHVGWMLCALLAAAVLATTAHAATVQERYQSMSQSTKTGLDRIEALNSGSLTRIAERVDATSLREMTEQIMASGALSVGARDAAAIREARQRFEQTGDPDDLRVGVHRFLYDKLTSLGLEHVASLKGQAVVPVRVDNRLDAALNEPASKLTVGSRTWPVYPLWPNGVMPSICPTEGITGPLVYVGDGRWSDINGLDLDGVVAVMNFAGGRNYERMFSLGAQAVIVIADDEINRLNAEGLFHNTPVPAPRFYIPAADMTQQGVHLLDVCTRKTAAQADPSQASDGDEPAGDQPTAPAAAGATAKPVIVEGQQGTLTGGHVFERRPYESMFFYLPPTAPTQYRIDPRDLADRIAADAGVSLQQLIAANPGLDLTDLQPGAELEIPGQRSSYTVREGDLLDRLAVQFGVEDPKQILEVNELKSASELRADVVLRIPNRDETVFLYLPMDSVSVVPDQPHGAKSAANVALLIRILEHLTADDGAQSPIRRKGLLIALLDAEHLGGLSSRTFAEYVLLADGKLGAQDEEIQFSITGLLIGIFLGALIGATLGYVLAGGPPDEPVPPAKRIRPTVITTVAVMLVGAAIALSPWFFGGKARIGLSDSQRLEYYENVNAWMQDHEANPLSEEAAQWFADDWLTRRIEKSRTESADRGARLGAQQANMTKGSPAYKAIQQRINAYEAVTLRIADLRNETLNAYGKTWAQRVNALWDELRRLEAEDELPDPELTVDQLEERFERELIEERERRRFYENNLEAVKAILRKAHPGVAPDARGLAIGDATAGWHLTLSDGSATFGLLGSSQDFRGRSYPSSSLNRNFENRFHDVTTYASYKASWAEDWVFLRPDVDGIDYPVDAGKTPFNYAEFWAVAGIGMLPMGTHNEQLVKLDTPRDVPAQTNFENLAVQAKHAATLIALGLEHPTDSLAPERLTRPDLGRLVGRILQFNARSGIDAQETVPGVLVYSPLTLKTYSGVSDASNNTATFRGARRGVVEISRLNGSYNFPVETIEFVKSKGAPVIYAYRFDRESALFDLVVDQGQIGTQRKSANFDLAANLDREKNLIVTSVYPWVFFPGADPMDYQDIGNPGAGQEIKVIDAVVNGEPAHYAVDNPSREYKETSVEGVILYAPPDTRARVLAQQNVSYKMLLIGEVLTEAEAKRLSEEQGVDVESSLKGRGYEVGPREGDRNVFLANTPMHVARDMLDLARLRQKQYASRNLVDQGVDEALDRAEAKLAEAEAAAGDRDWLRARGATREGWGMLVKFYPRILRLGREAVFSAIILMALLVPASMFLEKLLIGAKEIVWKLLGTSVIFILAVIFLQLTHPALLIAVSPFIVMIAFVMILMAIVVLVLSYQRFEVLVRRARVSAGEIESEEISLLSSLGTALSLGVSNLKKRPSRTFLTAMTVSVLTFSIITFVSVKGEDALDQKRVTLESEIEGEAVEPLAPKYEGVVFRDFNWHGLGRNFVSAIRSEFGSDFDIVTRGFYIEVEGGNNADREGTNQIPVRRLDDVYAVQPGDTLADVAEKLRVDPETLRRANPRAVADDGALAHGATLRVPRSKAPATIMAVMTFEPGEVRFSHLHEAVSNQQWFAPEGSSDSAAADRLTVILPDEAARKLGIRAEDLYLSPDGSGPATPEQIAAGQGVLRPAEQLPQVNMRNTTWRVIGIVDTTAADRYRDVTGKSLAIVDFIKSAFSSNASGEIENETASYHVSWRQLAIVPVAAEQRIEAKPRSVAIRFDDKSPEQIERFRRDIELRINRAMFGSFDGQLALLTTKTSQSVGGLAQIIVPVLLCVLIVLNTMMGAVDERKGEVSMLGAIGLSPGQISFLLLSESMVFSVLGIIFGTLTGLAFAWLIPTANAVFDTQVLTALSFNFTSVMAMLLAMGTGVVVLLATLIPARKAAALAAPSGMERWELPEPDADGHIVFELPFTLTRGNAVGMMAFFRRFLLNHTEATSEDFNCRDIRVWQRTGEGQALCIDCDMWLAPYDLDVSQHLSMEVLPTANPGVFSVVLTLERHSGAEESWMRTNYGFLNLVRHQFLIWRNLQDQQRIDYIEQGAALFQESSS